MKLILLLVTLLFNQVSSSTSVSSTSPTTTSASTSPTTTTADPPNDRLCYSCADSTEKEGGNACQVRMYEMMVEAGHTLNQLATTDSKSRQKHLASIDYVKNCSRLGQEFKYCIIEEVETRGNVFSYIRDCSDGKTFSKGVSDVDRIAKYIQSDNQTLCGYSDQGYQYCVTLCESDFCNGPIPSMAASYTSDVRFISLLSILFLFNHRQVFEMIV